MTDPSPRRAAGAPEPPFAHGVASFDPTQTSVLLWTRSPGVGRLRWFIAPDPTADAAVDATADPAVDGRRTAGPPGEAGTTGPVASGEVTVPPDRDHCVSVTVDGLEPATRYVYWFEAGPTRSPVGRTRTLPATGTDPLRLAVLSCGDHTMGHFAAYRAVAESDVDLVLHVGDYIYETAKGSRRPAVPDHELITVDDYRARYAQTRSDPDLLALHMRHPMVAVWDDHDIADNAWRHGAKHHDPNEDGPWDERLDAAARAHQDWVPARLCDPDDLLTVYRSFTVGDLAEVVVLDTRIVGRDQQADDDPSLPFDDPRRSLLGDAQREWAHERVRDSSRPWCLLVSQVVVNRMQLPVPIGASLGDMAPSGYAVLGGQALCTDEWDGYPAERDALTRVIAERGRGVVTLSGDVHSAWAFEGPCLDGEPVAVEMVAPCVTATPMARQLPRGWRKLLGKVAEQLPEARWFELERHGFLILEVDADEVRAHWYAVDTEDPDARAEHAASWRHRVDRPGRLEPLDEPAPPVPAPAGPSDRAAAAREPAAVGSPPPAGPPAPTPLPGRPPEVLAAAERRRTRRRRAAALGIVAAVAALAGAAVTRARRGSRPANHQVTGPLVAAWRRCRPALDAGLRAVQARVKRAPSAPGDNGG